jgi:hypothetical protein
MPDFRLNRRAAERIVDLFLSGAANHSPIKKNGVNRKTRILD